MQKKLKKLAQKGFSLVELLVVIAIIAILSIVAYTSFSGSTDKAKDSRVLGDLDSLQLALESYKVSEGAYPDLLESGPVEDGKIPKSYLSRIPTDPGKSKQPYFYRKEGSTFQIAGVLRGTTDLTGYSNHIVGNSDLPLLKTDGVAIGFYNNNGTLAPCDADVDIVEGVIGSKPDGSAGACIAYDPTK